MARSVSHAVAGSAARCRLRQSNTDTDTNATTRPVTFGAVPAARTVVFMTPIHSSTGSGVAANTGEGIAASSAASSTSMALRIVTPARRSRKGPCLDLFNL